MIKIGIIALEVALGLIVTVTSIVLNSEEFIASAPEISAVVSLNLNKKSSGVLPATSSESNPSSLQE